MQKVCAYPLTASKFYSIRTKFLILKRDREESYSPFMQNSIKKYMVHIVIERFSMKSKDLKNWGGELINLYTGLYLDKSQIDTSPYMKKEWSEK